MFDTSKLLLEQMIFEVRFEHAFLYWDNSGKIFNELLKGWPTATVETVSTQEAKVHINCNGSNRRIGVLFLASCDAERDYLLNALRRMLSPIRS
jgi:hypothetical protein